MGTPHGGALFDWWRSLWHSRLATEDLCLSVKVVKKVKASHTRYRALGPELIPVYMHSAWMTWSHPPGSRLPLLFARPEVTFPAEKHHRTSAGTKLYCLVPEAHACEQLVQGCYLEADRPRFEPATFRIASVCSAVKPHGPPSRWYISIDLPGGWLLSD